jgi:hypothetical protein
MPEIGTSGSMSGDGKRSVERPARSGSKLGVAFDRLSITVVALMLLCAFVMLFLPREVETPVQSSLERVAAPKLRFLPFTDGQRWLLTFAYFVNPWASNRSVVGDLLTTGAIADSPVLAGLVGQQMSQKALFIATQISTKPGEYAAVWYGDLKESDLPGPVDANSRESVMMFLSKFGASGVIFPIPTPPLPDRLMPEQLITWGQQLHFTVGEAPAVAPPRAPTGPTRPPV